MLTRILLWIALSAFVVLSSEGKDTGSMTLPYDFYNFYACGSNHYRDSSNFLCGTCPTGQEVDESTIGGDGDYEGCHCSASYTSVENDCSSDASGNCHSLSCTDCKLTGKVSYSDRTGCVSCGPTTLGFSSSTDCKCPDNYVLVEKDLNGAYAAQKSCVECGTGTAVITTSQYIAGKAYVPDKYSCQSCPDPLMSMTVTSGAYSCACAASHTLVGVSGVGAQSCVLTTLTEANKNNVAQASLVTYYDSRAEGTITSLTFQHYYLKAVSRCLYFGTPADVVYCHQLANLCVLQLYDDTSLACIAHKNIIAQRGTNTFNSIDNWVTGQPWIFFSGEANAVCNTFAFKKRVTLNSLTMHYLLVTYYMNGTFAGYQDLNTQLAYCTRKEPNTKRGGGNSRSTDWLIFGTNEKYTFSCQLSTLMQKEQLFYELYVYRKDDQYTPVPVRITNTLSQGVSSINADNTPNVEVVRYAAYISIEASLVTNKFARIYAPVLTITYNEDKPASWGKLETHDVNFSMYYTMNMSEFDANFRIFFIIIMVFTGLLFALRYRHWQVRNSRVVTSAVLTTDLGGFNMSTLTEIALIASNTWNLVFFPVTVCIAWYAFTFFKMQTAPSVLLPPENNIYSPSSPYYLFTVNIHVMAFFQLWYVLVMIYRQCKADLFFIDWEPTPTKPKGEAHTATKNQVSVWRTILVANEWTELQSVRKTDIRFTLFFLGFVLLGAYEEFNATHQPVLENKSTGHINCLLRFANTTFYWLLFSYGQYAWKFFFAERYLGEPPERLFVDFCTIAKISVIVLDEKYHGYYLHCRSPHQYADGTMTELVGMLHKEEAGLTVDRSLEGAPADVQTFQIFMSGEWREAFDKIRNTLVGEESVAEVMNDNRNRAMSRATARSGASSAMRGSPQRGAAGASLNNLPSDRVLKAWKEMLVFLQEFVENNFGKACLRRVVREPTYWEKLSNAGPELAVPDQPSVFFTDREYNYCKVWFLGRELELLSLNILSYSLFDIWFNNTAISILLTYLLDLGLACFRHWFGQAMISKKTLIDNRFLI